MEQSANHKRHVVNIIAFTFDETQRRDRVTLEYVSALPYHTSVSLPTPTSTGRCLYLPTLFKILTVTRPLKLCHLWKELLK